MAMFAVNSTRIDPYSNFRFLVVFGTEVVAGASKVSGLKQTIEVVEHRDGGDLSTKRKSPGLAFGWIRFPSLFLCASISAWFWKMPSD